MPRFSPHSLFTLALVCVLTPVSAHAQVINEYVANHTGSPDTNEYVEIFGAALTDYSNLTIVEIECDVSTTTGTIGRVDQFFAVTAP